MAERNSKTSAPSFHTKRRFPERVGAQWHGPVVDYKEIEMLRKFLTSSSKLMSRRRSGTDVQEQRSLRLAVKRARFLALVPFAGS